MHVHQKMNHIAVAWSIVLSFAMSTSSAAQQPEKLGFNRDVRPILASKCFACHGPDEDHRESGMRLDVREEAIDAGAIEPGDSDASELVLRIFSSDAEEIMPPPHAENALTESEKETLKRWVSGGAEYQRHWAFVPPVSPALPDVGNRRETQDWIVNPIDRFVLEQLQSQDLKPSPAASEYMLLRRVYLDLIGLPPTVEETKNFVQSKQADKYERVVDQLLASPRYGEHWARPWLDLARYSDTNGYEKDRDRTIWPYRDWVIRALNDDLPYDDFSIYQLAGDMLPSPTPDQIIATGFHRNTMLNEEGGVDPQEYRFYAMVDRVATTGTVWMGLTTGCAQCHTHKFDPITHTDYYRMMALLNNAEEPDFTVPDSNKEKRREELNRQISRLEEALAFEFSTAMEISAAKDEKQTSKISEDKANDSRTKKEESAETKKLRAENLQAELTQWYESLKPSMSDWEVIRPVEMKSNLPRLTLQEDGSIFSTGDITKRDEYTLTFDLGNVERPIQSILLEAIPDPRLPAGGPGRTFYEGRKGDFFVSEVDATIDGKKLEFANASDSYATTVPKNKKGKNFVLDGNGSSGWRPMNRKATRLQLVLNLSEPVEGSKLQIKLLFERHYAVSLGRFRFSVSNNAKAKANQLPAEAERLIATKPREDWTDKEQKFIQREFLLATPLLKQQREKIDRLRGELPKPTETLVMQERPSNHVRPTYRHHRGEYLSPKELVAPGIISVFAEGDANETPQNRLEFARWLVSEKNPLAARVAVNRAWRAFFGRGLVQTDGDYGVQSQAPSHPALLDWMAVDFREQGWSLKRLHRQIVLSQTYRQSSEPAGDSSKKDPDNMWLSRGPRFRLTGETFRDSILHATGLLSKKMYGPGVRPPQPHSVTQLAWSSPKWNASTGEDRYRRSIYTFGKRTAAFAAFTVFDGPTGETCMARRGRSNTPLQALTVLNDEMFLEMARALGKTLAGSGGSAEEKIVEIYQRFLVRPPSDQQKSQLLEYYQQQKNRLVAKQLDAKEIVGIDSVDAAALAMVARVVMNLDETVTRQ